MHNPIIAYSVSSGKKVLTIKLLLTIYTLLLNLHDFCIFLRIEGVITQIIKIKLSADHFELATTSFSKYSFS